MVRLLLLWGGTCMRWTLIIETAIERVRNCLHDLIFSSKVQWQNFQTTLTYNKGSSSSSVLLRAAVENWDMRNRHYYVRSRRWRFLSQLSNFHFPLTAQHYSAHLTVKSKIDKSFFSAFFPFFVYFFFVGPSLSGRLIWRCLRKSVRMHWHFSKWNFMVDFSLLIYGTAAPFSRV